MESAACHGCISQALTSSRKGELTIDEVEREKERLLIDQIFQDSNGQEYSQAA